MHLTSVEAVQNHVRNWHTDQQQHCLSARCLSCCCALCRCHQPCVCKWFKTGAVYEDAFFANDLKAVDKAQEIIDAFNDLQIANTIHLNRPEVWRFKPGSRCALLSLHVPIHNSSWVRDHFGCKATIKVACCSA